MSDVADDLDLELEPTVELPLRPTPPTAVERFGRNLAAARAWRQLSQAEVATAADLDPSYISLIEAGKRVVGLDIAERLAEAVKVPLGTLLMATGPFEVSVCAECRRRPT